MGGGFRLGDAGRQGFGARAGAPCGFRLHRAFLRLRLRWRQHEIGLPPADPAREERQIARLRKLSEEADLDPEFSEKFLRFIIDEVIRHHERAAAG